MSKCAMTVREAAKHLGVSTSTVYRRIRKGILVPARTDERPRRVWIEVEVKPKQERPMQWHSQINRRYAEQAGLTPADFTWLKFPVSNVRLSLPRDQDNHRWNLIYLATMPSDTPHVNQYIQEKDRQPGVEYESAGAPGWLKIPDPRGSALSSVRFSLIDLVDGAVLHDDERDHVSGQVQGGMTEARRDLIWKRLTPGTSLRVRLEAIPLFFPYNNPDTGDGGNHYSTVNQGYLNGDTASSGEHTLALSYDGVLSLDEKSVDSRVA